MRILKGGKLYYDVPVGIICLESAFPKPRGHVRNPTTFSFPSVMKVLPGLSVQKLLFKPTKDLAAIFIQAARELEEEGVQAITGSCGFMGRFQSDIANAVSVPVAMSSLLQLPLVRAMHGANDRIGILTAAASALGPAHFYGFDMDNIMIRGMENSVEFRQTILEGSRNDFDLDKLREEITNTAVEFAKDEKLAALILECTDLSSFARSIQDKIGLPVYDLNGLVEYLCYSVSRKNY